MLAGVGIFLLILFSLLAIPVTLVFRISWPQSTVNNVSLHWAFGLIRTRIPTNSSAEASSHADIAEESAKQRRRSSGKKLNVLAAVRQRRFRQRIIRFVSDLWRAFRKQNIRLRVCIGLGDPAATGQLWAFVGPFSGLLNNVQSASIIVEPEFLESTIEIDGSGSLRVVPLRLIALTGALLLSPPIWSGIREMREAT